MPLTQRQIDEAPGGTYNEYGYTSSGDRISNPNPVSNTRYTGPNPVNPTGSLYDQFAERTAGNLDLTPADPQKIFEQKMRDYQGLVDSLNFKFDDQIRQANRQEEANLGEARALQANAGIQTTPMGMSQNQNLRNYSEAQRKSIDNDRNLAVQEIFGRVRAEARDEIKAQKELALGNTEKYLSFLKNQQVSYKTKMSELGAMGMTSKELKSKDVQGYEKIKQILGLDDGELDLYLNNARDEATKIKYEAPVKLEDGRVMLFGIDPLTGKHVQNILDANVPANSKAVYATVNGVSGLFYEDENGNLTPSPSAQKLSMDKRKIDLDARLTESQIAENYQSIEKSKADMSGVSDKNLTVDQSKARGFARTAEEAESNLGGYDPGFFEFGLPNQAKTSARQGFEQASRAFVNSILRRESGATITDDEFKNKYKELIPGAGESQSVKDQKKALRDIQIRNLKEAGLLSSTPSGGGQQIEYNGQIYNVDANGNMTPA